MGLDLTGLGAGFDVVKEALSLIPNANVDKQNAAAQALATLQGDYSLLQAQIAVNQAEAANPHFFVCGWRPALCWGCSAIFLLVPLSTIVAKWFGHDFSIPDSIYLQISGLLMYLVGVRTFDKLNKIPDSITTKKK
jgi:hypothetical protein